MRGGGRGDAGDCALGPANPRPSPLLACRPQVLSARLLHITCLPTLQLQRCEEYYGALLHEQHAEVRGLFEGGLGTATGQAPCMAGALPQMFLP